MHLEYLSKNRFKYVDRAHILNVRKSEFSGHLFLTPATSSDGIVADIPGYHKYWVPGTGDDTVVRKLYT